MSDEQEDPRLKSTRLHQRNAGEQLQGAASVESARSAEDAENEAMLASPDSLTETLVTVNDPGQSSPGLDRDISTQQTINVSANGLPDVIGGFGLGDKLGEGGMGVVYNGTAPDGTPVALKILKPESVNDDNAIDRFLREVKTAERVHHPNVLRLIGGGRDGGLCFMATEFVDGGDLSDEIHRRGVYTEAKALSVIAQCTAGLQAIADAGLIHRDIKPGNIFMRADGTPVIGDLGLARQVDGDDRMTMTGLAMGTPSYMSPEHVRGLADVDIRTDIYALGAMLFKLVTGEEPYTGDTLYVITNKILQDPIPDPRRLNGALSAGICAIMYRCLAKQRTDRYGQPKELAQDIDCLIHGRPLIHARGVDLTKRNPLRAAGGAPKPAAERTFAPQTRGGWWASLPLGIRRGLVLVICAVVIISFFGWVLEGLGGVAGGDRSTNKTAAVTPQQPRWAKNFGEDSHGWYADLAIGDQLARMRWCPPGEYVSGSPANEYGRSADEQQTAQIIPQGFWLAAEELQEIHASEFTSALPDQPVFPARFLSWQMADEFCRQLSLFTGATVRLPTEVEWEYACRAGGKGIGPFGAWATAEQAGHMASGEILVWWQEAERSGEDYGYVYAKAEELIPIGARPANVGNPNSWGLKNMLGNVAEWCQDDLDGERALRGGSWLEPSERCRAAVRSVVSPDLADRTTGMRLLIQP